MIEENEIIENKAINDLKRFLNQRQEQREKNTSINPIEKFIRNSTGNLTQTSTFTESAKQSNGQIRVQTKTHMPLRKTSTLQRYDYQSYRKSKNMATPIKKHVSINRGIIKKPESLHTFDRHSDIQQMSTSSQSIQTHILTNNLQEDEKTTHNSLNSPPAENINECITERTSPKKTISEKITLFDALNFQDMDDILYIIKNSSHWSKGLKFSIIMCSHIFILIFSVGFWYSITPKLTPMAYLDFMQALSIIDGIVIVSMIINSFIFLIIGGLKNV